MKVLLVNGSSRKNGCTQTALNEAAKALKEEGLEWPNFRSQEVSDLYRVKSVPTMYLIDSKGVLVGTDLRGEALVKKLAELFQ